MAALVLRHEGKSIRRSGVHASAGSIQLIAALRAAFLLMQCEAEEHQLLPRRQLVPAKVTVSCPRSMSLSLENVTRELPDFDGEAVEQLIPVAALGELGDLTADDIIHGDNADHAGNVDAPERLLEARLQDVFSCENSGGSATYPATTDSTRFPATRTETQLESP